MVDLQTFLKQNNSKSTAETYFLALKKFFRLIYPGAEDFNSASLTYLSEKILTNLSRDFLAQNAELTLRIRVLEAKDDSRIKANATDPLFGSIFLPPFFVG